MRSADEWIPIKPGTDGALALAMLHVMVHELGIYDVKFLKKHTNAPYLIQSDGLYLRDEEAGKPLVWDLTEGKAKPFDAPDLANPAIEGLYEIQGKTYKPAFQILKDHLEAIDVAEMARITTVPAERIRRIVAEFCEAASIGSTIQIMGHTLPYRPAAIDFKRGAAAHKGGLNSCIAIHLLNILIGAIDVPGGQRGVNPRGPYWNAEISPDGLMVPADYITKYNKPYPGSPVKAPLTLDLRELFPVALFTRGLFPWGIAEPEKFGIE
ncbi:MAG: molybdopterin-dependent oxidoreductase [Deltaproteobacteria bacterium]|nr:molybdopterin-dependent oxidoreductase [Deltaproteobacteria bacterium]